MFKALLFLHLRFLQSQPAECAIFQGHHIILPAEPEAFPGSLCSELCATLSPKDVLICSQFLKTECLRENKRNLHNVMAMDGESPNSMDVACSAVLTL